MSALVALCDAVTADLLANVSLPAQNAAPWKYVEARVENPEDCPFLNVWTDGAVYSLIATPNEYMRHWTITVDWYVFNQGGIEYGGASDDTTVVALEPVVEALAARVSQYMLPPGIPGYTGAVGGTSSAVGRLVSHAVMPVEGNVYRGRVELEVEEEVDL